MEYNITPVQAGNYKINMRISTPNYGTQLQIINRSGNVLSTYDIPTTGRGVWKTYSTTIPLSAGAQKLRVKSSKAQHWNINWLELVYDESNSARSKSLGENGESMDFEAELLNDKLLVRVNETITGPILIEIFDESGTIKKAFTLVKDDAVQTQYYLSSPGLNNGNYNIRITTANKIENLKIQKL
jgi:hypothetical protein